MGLISILKKKNQISLFTTPSHGGKFCIFHKFYQWYRSDISEVDAYNPQQALKDAENKASKIYKTKSTHFLTNGSTSGIIASILACTEQNDKILIWSKSHPCHKNGAKLAGAEVIKYELPYNSDWGVFEAISPDEVEKLLQKHSPKTIVVTSPSYEGIVSDIKSISEVCKKYNTYLIVDEAHGALYPFSDKLPQSAVNYADFTVQSLHKTAGGINPTALLHCKADLDIESALKLITTTSPSYPMLATIEANINYLKSSKGKQKIVSLIDEIQNIKNEIKNLEFYGDDPTKILVKHPKLLGEELSELLFDKYKIEDERSNEKSVMLLTGIGTSKEKLNRLKSALMKIDKSI